MTIVIRVIRDAHLEAARGALESLGRPCDPRIAYLVLKIAVIFRLAGSSTASRG
jgi:hypothetical protein